MNSELTAQQFNSLNFAAVKRKRLGSGKSVPPPSTQPKFSGGHEKRRKECAQLELFPPDSLSLKISSCFISLWGNNRDVYTGFQRQKVKYLNLDKRQLEASAGFTIKEPGLKFQLFH